MLVTGASRGFGAACVEVFGADGWDVTDDDVGPLRTALAERPLDLLINNAGAGTPGTPLEDVDVATLLNVCDVNVGGVIRATLAPPRRIG